MLHDGLHGSVNCALDAALHNHGVGACGYVLHAFPNQSLSQQGSGGGAVAGSVVCFGGDFFYQLSAHVLEGVGKLDLFGNGHAVVGDEGSAVLLIQNHVAALGAQGDLNSIGQLINTGLQSLAGFIAAHNELRHNSYLRIFLKVGDCVPPLPVKGTPHP